MLSDEKLSNSLDRDRALQNVGVRSGSTLFDNDGIPDFFFFKSVLEKNQQTTKIMQNYSGCKEL